MRGIGSAGNVSIASARGDADQHRGAARAGREERRQRRLGPPGRLDRVVDPAAADASRTRSAVASASPAHATACVAPSASRRRELSCAHVDRDDRLGAGRRPRPAARSSRRRRSRSRDPVARAARPRCARRRRCRSRPRSRRARRRRTARRRGSGCSTRAGTTARSANVERKRVVVDRLAVARQPRRAVEQPAVTHPAQAVAHRCGRSRRHSLAAPARRAARRARRACPGAAPRPRPTASTTPAPSWPSTAGQRVAAVPSIALRSEWQTPLACRRTSTSPGPGGASSSSVTSSGAPTRSRTAARTFSARPRRARAGCPSTSGGRSLTGGVSARLPGAGAGCSPAGALSASGACRGLSRLRPPGRRGPRSGAPSAARAAPRPSSGSARSARARPP